MTSSVLHPSWPRAAANALWKPLRHAHLYGWPVSVWDVNDPTGDPGHGWSNAGSTPRAIPRTEPREGTERIITYVPARNAPGGQKLAVMLTKTAHDAILAERGRQGRYEYSRALRQSTVRHPFTLDKNRHGNQVLRRNPKDILITPLVTTILEALAVAATVRVVTPADEARADRESWEPVAAGRVKPAVVFAIAEKAGVTTS